MKYVLQSTATFDSWLNTIDRSIKPQLLSRLARIENGNFGDFKALTGGVYELRCFFGGGLRVYYALRDLQVVLLLAGGNKSSQSSDIDKARELLQSLET